MTTRKNKLKRTFDWRFLLTLIVVFAMGWFFYVRSEASKEDRADLRAHIDEQDAQILEDDQEITVLQGIVEELRQRCADADDCVAPTMEQILAQLPQSSSGLDGRDGRDGRDGLDGTAGRSGLDGTDGRSGLDGQDGDSGSDGQPGVDGQDGSPGKDGVDGKDGQPGKDGADGRDGADGQSAYPFSFVFTIPANGPFPETTYTVACDAPGACTTTQGSGQ